MASYNFEGDINGVTERQQEFIYNVVQEQGFGNSKVTFEPVGKPGDNYSACVKRIIIEGENSSLSIIVKLAPPSEILRQMASSDIIFSNEHYMYTEILPKLDQLQQEADIPENEQLRIPKCYGSLIEKPNEVILIEDLRPLNFEMLDRFQPLSNDSIKSVLKNFAILHSLSYRLRYKDPETYNNLKDKLFDLWVIQASSEEMKMMFQQLENETLLMLTDTKHKDLVRDKISDSLKLLPKFAKIENESKYSVIVHGDAWTNNVMFKMAGDQTEESILIDYQLSRPGSPAADLMYLIFNCTDYSSRKQYYYEWLDYYYSELEKYLSLLDLKANFVYPRDRLDADLRRYSKMMFGLSILLGSMLVLKSDEAAKIKEAMQKEDGMAQMREMGIALLEEDSQTLFKNKIIGLINSFTEFGLL